MLNLNLLVASHALSIIVGARVRAQGAVRFTMLDLVYTSILIHVYFVFMDSFIGSENLLRITCAIVTVIYSVNAGYVCKLILS